MRSYKIEARAGMLVAAGLLLTACSSFKANHNYVKQANSVPPVVVPAGVPSIKQAAFFPVPEKTRNLNPQPVSLVPPGSHLTRVAKKAKKKNIPIRYAAGMNNIVKAKNGSPVLVLSETPQKAWVNIGRALRATPYTILVRASNLGTYYILDREANKNQITKKTPIYSVVISKEGANARVDIMNRGSAINPKVANRILKAIQQKLA